ncbi:hypothetical protein [Quadrisphaera sp. DSM 44207]|uniref:hypothetical protein n=1 Tax=Quadrisphaera sp. DSM 44207 TaxID=1881057 RepID=UPI0008851E72|nr:hypothetical protein [Quadrisphaera sp. DSM 44207]SDQ54025.1 hypothetical protein SAMN05428996_2097 [Quadrisphaera sp. DSM 44207]
MPKTAALIGAALVAVGLWAYLSSMPGASPTALIPAVIGAVLVVCGVVGRREGTAAHRHAMHAAAGVALLGFLGSVGQLAASPAAGSENAGTARVAGLLNLLLCAAFVALAVRAFTSVRRERRRTGAVR